MSLPRSGPVPSPNVSEASLQRLLLARLNELPGGWFWRQNTGAARTASGFVRFGIPGQADITGVLNGRRVEVECKAMRGRLTEQQKIFGQRIEALGGRYVVARVSRTEQLHTVIQRVLAEVQS